MASAEIPSQETCESTFESAVAMALHLWAPLSFAVESNLGGGDGGDKRDWFAGAVCELFDDAWHNTPISTSQSATVTEDLLMDVEARLLQVMDDEFDTVVDDGSAYDVARQVVGLWAQCRRGDFAGAQELRRRWEAARGKKVAGQFTAAKQAADDDTAWQTDDEDEDADEDDDDDDEDDEDADGGADVNMDEAPDLVEAQPREKKPPPEVDEDGFTKVTRKKR